MLSRSRKVSPETVSVRPYASANHAERKRPLDPLDERDRHLLPAVDDHPNRREVAPLDVRQRHDRVHHRGCQPYRRHPRPLDLVDDCGRVEHAMDDGGRARGDERRGREVERADVVQRPASQPEIAAGEAELDDVREVLPRQIGVGDHDSLRTTRRSRGVHQPVDVVAGGGNARPDARRRPEIRERRPRVRGRLREADPDGPAFHPLHRVVGEIDERFVAHQRASSRVVKDVPQLRRGEPPVDRHRDRTQVVRREDRLQELSAVVRQEADDIARADPALVQPGRQRGRSRGQLAVGDGLAAEDREWLVRRAARVVLEHSEPADVRLHQRRVLHGRNPIGPIGTTLLSMVP